MIYELHVGAFTPEGVFDAIVPRLPQLAALGVTAIELMPVAQFPGDRNWGYDGVHPYAVQNSYGGPRALQRLVDAAHRHGLAVLLDVVYNHLGPEGNYLAKFGPYFTDRYHTPWGSAINFDGPDSDAVRQFVIDNACAWVRDFHARRPPPRRGADHLRPRRRGTSWPTSRPRCRRRPRAPAAPSTSSPRAIRTTSAWCSRPPWAATGWTASGATTSTTASTPCLTGQHDGFYMDFGRAEHLAKALGDVFVYDGCYSPFHRRRHGSRVAGLDRTHFVVCVQNHDQLGNSASGDRLGAVVPPPAQRLAVGLLMLSPCVPLLFMGEEYGEERPFPFFCSFGDAALAAAVWQGRRKEFASLRFYLGDGDSRPAGPGDLRRGEADLDVAAGLAARRSGGNCTRTCWRPAAAGRRWATAGTPLPDWWPARDGLPGPPGDPALLMIHRGSRGRAARRGEPDAAGSAAGRRSTWPAAGRSSARRTSAMAAPAGWTSRRTPWGPTN